MTIPGSDVLWTTFAPEGSARVQGLQGTSTLQLTNFPARDYHTLDNGLANGPSNPVSLNLTITWDSRPQFRDVANGFFGVYLGELATIQWSATGATFTFTSDPPSPDTQTDSFSTVSKLRNGVFFP